MRTYILIQLLCQLIPSLGVRDEDDDDNQHLLPSLSSKDSQCPVAQGLVQGSVPYTCNSKDHMKASYLNGMEEGLTYFDHRLGCFLEAVWGKEEAMESENDVYGMYVGSSESRPPDDTQLKSELEPFLEKVGQLLRGKTLDGAGLQLQNGRNYGQPQLWKERPRLTRDQKLWLWGDFYHILPLNPVPPGTIIATRMYIHSSTPMNGLDIVEAILDYIMKNPDVHGVEHLKIAGPGAVRDDNIVLYLTNTRKTMFLAELAGTLDATLFAATLPPLVEPIRPGIGFADEPTIIQGLEEAPVSFGSLYSSNIINAIKIARQSNPNEPDVRRFLKEVWRQLVKLKIDPCNHASFINAASEETQRRNERDAVVKKVAVP